MIRYKYIIVGILLAFVVLAFANYKDNQRNKVYDICHEQYLLADLEFESYMSDCMSDTLLITNK